MLFYNLFTNQRHSLTEGYQLLSPVGTNQDERANLLTKLYQPTTDLLEKDPGFHESFMDAKGYHWPQRNTTTDVLGNPIEGGTGQGNTGSNAEGNTVFVPLKQNFKIKQN